MNDVPKSVHCFAVDGCSASGGANGRLQTGIRSDIQSYNESYEKRPRFLYQEFPKFLPSFVGGPSDGFGDVYFDVSPEQFWANAHRGTTEDQMFFSSLLFSDVKLGEPADGCTNYGEVDWVSLLKDLVRLKKTIKNGFYAKWITDFENGFLEEPGPEWGKLRPMPSIIRSCEKNKGAVLKDLKAIRDFVKKEPLLVDRLPKNEQMVEFVESGKIEVEVVYEETTP